MRNKNKIYAHLMLILPDLRRIYFLYSEFAVVGINFQKLFTFWYK